MGRSLSSGLGDQWPQDHKGKTKDCKQQILRRFSWCGCINNFRKYKRYAGYCMSHHPSYSKVLKAKIFWLYATFMFVVSMFHFVCPILAYKLYFVRPLNPTIFKCWHKKPRRDRYHRHRRLHRCRYNTWYLHWRVVPNLGCNKKIPKNGNPLTRVLQRIRAFVQIPYLHHTSLYWTQITDYKTETVFILIRNKVLWYATIVPT